MPIKIGDLTCYTIAELSKKLGATERALRAAIRDGHLGARRVGGRWLVEEQSLGRYLRGEDAKTKPKVKRRG